MSAFDTDLMLHWLDHTAQLAQRLCVVVVAAMFCIRAEGLRRAVRSPGGRWQSQVVVTAFFALLAVIGTHGGIVMDLEQNGRVGAWDFAGLPGRLRDSQAILGFRDSMALVAGLIGGHWVGGGAGLLAGLERGHWGASWRFPAGFRPFSWALAPAWPARSGRSETPAFGAPWRWPRAEPWCSVSSSQN